MTTMTQPTPHPPEWWDRLLSACGPFDDAVATERLAELILPQISRRMMRREAELAVNRVVWSLIQQTPELRATALKVTERLEVLLLRRRNQGDEEDGVSGGEAICRLLRQQYGEAVAAAEAAVGMEKLLHAIFASVRSSTLHVPFTVELLKRGQEPEPAIRAGLALGVYRWWPTWLRTVATDLALAGRLDEETITALDRVGFAELNPAQAKMARKLIAGDAGLASVAASRLMSLGKADAAAALLQGDIEAIAIASKLTLTSVDSSVLRD